MNDRLIRALSILSILLFDSIVLGAGFLAEKLYDVWLDSESRFFNVAKMLSAGLFLLLYGVLVWHDISEELKDEWP